MPPAAVLSGTLLLGTPSLQVVNSRDVHPCDMVSRCPVSRCPPLLCGAALSGLVMSVLAISASPTKRAIPPKRCKIGPRLLWQTNRKSHTSFRLVPSSMTLDDLERPKCHFCRIKKVYGADHFNEHRPTVSGKIHAYLFILS